MAYDGDMRPSHRVPTPTLTRCYLLGLLITAILAVLFWSIGMLNRHSSLDIEIRMANTIEVALYMILILLPSTLVASLPFFLLLLYVFRKYERYFNYLRLQICIAIPFIISALWAPLNAAAALALLNGERESADALFEIIFWIPTLYAFVCAAVASTFLWFRTSSIQPYWDDAGAGARNGD